MDQSFIEVEKQGLVTGMLLEENFRRQVGITRRLQRFDVREQAQESSVDQVLLTFDLGYKGLKFLNLAHVFFFYK